MKLILTAAAAATLLTLGACNKHTDAGDNVVANADNAADNLEAVADNTSNDNAAAALDNKADATRAAGENKADAVDNAVANGTMNKK
jgi:protein involved in sex pheromone biosynthesis